MQEKNVMNGPFSSNDSHERIPRLVVLSLLPQEKKCSRAGNLPGYLCILHYSSSAKCMNNMGNSELGKKSEAALSRLSVQVNEHERLIGGIKDTALKT